MPGCRNIPVPRCCDTRFKYTAEFQDSSTGSYHNVLCLCSFFRYGVSGFGDYKLQNSLNFFKLRSSAQNFFKLQIVRAFLNWEWDPKRLSTKGCRPECNSSVNSVVMHYTGSSQII